MTVGPLAMDTPSFVSTVGGDESAFGRLWHGFMTARLMIALVLVLLHVYIYWLVPVGGVWVITLCAAYFLSCFSARLVAVAPEPGRVLQTQWLFTICLDVVVYATLQFIQSAGINYTALFALPVLLGAVLGSQGIGATAAGAVTLFLLAEATWPMPPFTGVDREALYLQAGLIGSGLMVEAFLASQMSARLLREESTARSHRRFAQTQVRVNELVIDNLAEGVLVIDAKAVVHAANPAARELLAPGGPRAEKLELPLLLTAGPWGPLAALAARTLKEQNSLTEDVWLGGRADGEQSLRVRTRLAAMAPQGQTDDGLCVMFLEDLRELEARVRNEKLAAMGRMSTAVAHEIRNPLAAISQANALLDEELVSDEHRQLTRMIRQNAERLDQIVEDVLNVARLQRPDPAPPRLSLDQSVGAACADWSNHARAGERLCLQLEAANARVAFNPDHLRRVLVNLLDNALRYTAPQRDAIVVSTEMSAPEQVILSVWSDAPPVEATVQRHLFEPFFSSESRSTGLGLYICRELCEQHGATIAYRRRLHRGRDGNDFHVTLRCGTAEASKAGRNPL